MMRKILLVLVILAANNTMFSQVETKIFPKGQGITIPFIRDLKQSTRVITLPDFDKEKMFKEDKEMEGCDVPFRFGKGFDVNVSLEDGDWQNCENGRIWSLSVESDEAFSLNFIFNEIFLPKGAELYIINQNCNIVYGPVTYNTIDKSDFFLTDIIPDSKVKILLFEPLEVKGKSKLSISRIVHGYKRVFVDMNGGLVGSSEPCNNDIACFPEYSIEAKAVALVLLSSGVELCSGSLVMTTDKSYKPYFLTAFHCVDTSKDGTISSAEKTDSENWLFKFNFRRNTCDNNSSIATCYTYNGASFKAAYYNTDFALMEISTDLSQYSNRHTWLGWDRTGTPPSNGFSIHHPSGDVMKISFENDVFSSSSWNGTNNHWLVYFDDGVVEHGSSGSPLINAELQIVGQLHGNQSYNSYESYCSQPRAEYGKFDLSWNGGNTTSTQLSHWLDPLGNNITKISMGFPLSISGANMVCTQEIFSISNMPTDSLITLNTNNSPTGVSILVSPNLNIYSYSNGSLTVRKISNGNGYIRVYYKGNLIAEKNVWVGAPVINDVYQNGSYVIIETDDASQTYDDSYYIKINNHAYPIFGGRFSLFLPHGTYQAEAYASNACGESDHYFTQIVIAGGIHFAVSNVSPDGIVTITRTDDNGEPLPREVLDTEDKGENIPYTLTNSLTGRVVARGMVPIAGGTLDFSKQSKGFYVLTLSPRKSKEQSFRISL